MDEDEFDCLREDVERIDGTNAALKILCAYLLAERAKEADDPIQFIATFSETSFKVLNQPGDDIWIESAGKAMEDIRDKAMVFVAANRPLN